MNGFLLLIARFWQWLAEFSSRRQSGGRTRAAAFVRYGGADDLGHLGWAFDLNASEVNAGAVENPKGTATCDPDEMGYWDVSTPDPMPACRERAYGDLKFCDLPKGDAVAAYGTVKWVALQPYSVIGRNCLDDVYDVLRAYGVPELPLPAEDLLPNDWFVNLDGEVAPVATYVWKLPPPNAMQHFASRLARATAPPVAPTWRRPGHPDWHDFQTRLAAASGIKRSNALITSISPHRPA